jgi:hypothetical protein
VARLWPAQSFPADPLSQQHVFRVGGHLRADTAMDLDPSLGRIVSFVIPRRPGGQRMGPSLKLSRSAWLWNRGSSSSKKMAIQS